MLDFRINTFLTACQCMNYTKTAELLHITQPAVTQHIHFLEEYYQAKLFLYEGKKLKLTAAGEMLYQMASAQQHDALYLRKKLAAGTKQGMELRFGVTMTIGEFVIAEPLSRFLKAHPDISVHIVTANTQELLKKIRQGEIEFALMEGNFSKEAYDSLIFSQENFIPVCAGDSLLAERSYSMEELLKERLIIREEGSGTREVLVKDLERRNLSLQDFSKVIEIGNMSAIKSLVTYDCGISFLYEAAVRAELETGVLRKMKLEDFHVVHDFSFVWQRGSVFDGEYKKIFQELREMYL